jgi:hypothetical protein
MSYTTLWKPYFNTRLNIPLSRLFFRGLWKTTEIPSGCSDLKDHYTDFIKDSGLLGYFF